MTTLTAGLTAVSPLSGRAAPGAPGRLPMMEALDEIASVIAGAFGAALDEAERRTARPAGVDAHLAKDAGLTR